MPDMSTVPVSQEVSELINKLRDKKSKQINISNLSRTQYIEQLVRQEAENQRII